MKEQITGTHIKWIAKGYWERYFYWRIYPKSKFPLILSAILFVALLSIIIFVGAMADVSIETEQISTTPYSGAIAVALGIILVLALVTLAVGLIRYLQDRGDFINFTVTHWEQGDTQLPNTETVIQYLKDKNILE